MNDVLFRYWLKVGFFWAVLGGEMLFAYVLKRRKLFWPRLAVAIVILHVIGFFVLPPLQDLYNKYVNGVPFYIYSFFFFLICFLLTLAALAFCFKARFSGILFCGVAGYLSESMSYGLQEIFSFVTSVNIARYVLLRIAFYAVSYVAVYFILSRKLKNNLDYLNNKITIITSSLILFFVLFIGTVIQFNLAQNISWALGLFRAFFCGISLFIQFNIWDRSKKQHELNTISQIWQKNKEHYEISKEIIESVNLKLHDLKYYALKSSANADMSELVDNIKLYDADIKTGNQALNVVLTENMLRCYKKDIRLSCMADGEKLNFMEDTDIYILFGNIMDNAVEAVVKVPDKEKWNITLTVTTAERLLNIHCENYFSAELEFVGDLPKTSKDNAVIHGYGTKSIKMISEKYGGNISINLIDDIFNLDILIPVKE